MRTIVSCLVFAFMTAFFGMSVNAAADTGFVLDMSNVENGTIDIRYAGNDHPVVNVSVIGPTGVRQQYLRIRNDGEYEAIPLSDGSGMYRIQVARQVPDGRFALALSCDLYVTLSCERAPFLQSNVRVDFKNAPETVAKAETVTAGLETEVEIISAIFEFVISNFEYNYELAASIEAGAFHRVNLDTALENGSGVCYDISAVTVGMLRSRGIPARLIFGYVGDVYHAWVDVYSKESGRIDDFIRLRGDSWNLLDPTIVLTGGEAGARFSGNPANYEARFIF